MPATVRAYAMPARVCSSPALADGTTCNDGSACTSGDHCAAGVCTGTTAVACPGDSCRAAGTCDPATGLCSVGAAVADGTSCNDGNHCTTQEKCSAGTCIPEFPVSGCALPTDNYYAPLVDIGSTQGSSAAWAINQSGEVVGADSRLSYANQAIPPARSSVITGPKPTG